MSLVQFARVLALVIVPAMGAHFAVTSTEAKGETRIAPVTSVTKSAPAAAPAQAVSKSGAPVRVVYVGR